MRFPLFTGEVASLLGTTEPKLSETVRRGRIKPEPRISAGRRLWSREQVFQAAGSLGIDPGTLDERLDRQGGE